MPAPGRHRRPAGQPGLWAVYRASAYHRMPDSRDFAAAFEDKDLALRIHRLLHRLPEPYREVFLLRVLGELSFRDIGSLFEKGENWACVTYHRARKKIMEQMEGTP